SLLIMATIIIPTPLRKFTQNESKVEANGNTVQETFEQLSTQYPDLQQQLFDEAGNIKSFLRIFKGNTDIRTLQNSSTIVSAETVLSIVPAIAGGHDA
ncbi:MAG TPA: MoaD/ThiS family protein, partial [Bacteroidia bacterium]|nr:MoaD/ThiS family protein [Bacteroidia bacterium]